MLIQCEKCSTRYNLDEAKIPGKGAKVTCPTCKHVFIVMKGATPGAPATMAPSGGPPAAPPPTPPPQGKSLLDNFFDDSKTVPGTPFGAPTAAPATPLGSGRAGIRSWKVRVASGLVYDFTDVATLKAWIAERKVTTADQISADGANWTVIGTIANLDAFFGPATPSPTPPPGSMGAPGPAPATGFGPAPANSPAAPAFAAAPTTSSSLADLFGAPPPGGNGGADPFATGNGSPAPSANPFGGAPPTSNPFGGPPPISPASAPTNPSSNPFATAPTNPSSNPFATSPSPDPFGPGAGDPFAAPQVPPPAFGSDPFATPAAPPGANPFGGDPFSTAPSPPPQATAAPTAPSSAPPPPQFGPKPAPPPWLSGPAPASPAGAAPAPFMSGQAPAPAVGGPPPKPASWSAAGEVTAQPAPIPPPKTSRKIGRNVGLALAGVTVLALGGGLLMNVGRIQAMLRPIPTPVETPTPPPIVKSLEGEARDHYLRGRRLLRVDTADAYKQAETEFRSALAKANGNPRAAAGVLESLALQKQAGAAVTDEALQLAQAGAGAALKEDAQGLETNRALAQLDAVSGRTTDAMGRLETALAAHPGDPEALFLRSKLRAADPGQAGAAAEDLTAAAADKTLTRAVLAKAEGAKPKSPEKKAADELAAANAAALTALGAGTWTWTPEEFPRLLPGEPVPTPIGTPVPVDSAVAIGSATPAASIAAPTPTPAKTPVARGSATPAKTPVASASPKSTKAPSPTRTPLAVASAEPNWDATPAPTPDGAIATASASDHFMAGQAYEQAASWDDAIAEYEQAVKLSAKTSSYRLALGTAQFRGGKLQDAATTLSDLIDREPNNASAHRVLGLLFEATGQGANACGEFQEYLRIKPQAPDAGDIRTRIVRNGC